MAQADMLVDGIWDMWLNLRDAFLPLYDNDPEKFVHNYATFYNSISFSECFVL